MKTMTWKTKLIIAAIVIALAGCGIVSAMSFGSLLLALVSLIVGWYLKHIYDKYFKDKN